MSDDNTIQFPDYNAPLPEDSQKRFDEIMAKLDKDCELYTSYLYDGPDPNPLTRRYQENLVNQCNEMLDVILYGKKK